MSSTKVFKFSVAATCAALLITLPGNTALAAAPEQVPLACSNIAHTPTSTAPNNAFAKGSRDGIPGCGNAQIDLYIYNDAVWGFDEEVGHTHDFFAVGDVFAHGTCKDVQVSRGYYSQLRINGEVVSESARVRIEHCRSS